MSSKNTIINILTGLLVLILAGSTAYFYLQSSDKKTTPQKTNNSKTDIQPQKTSEEKKSTDTGVKSPASEQQTNLTKPAVSTNRPSNPAKTYTIGPGETLFAISTKLDINWTRLTEINNLENGDNIKEGQILITPTYDEKTKKLYVEFQTDVQKSTQIQEQTTAKKSLEYLDPISVAKQDALGIYGLTKEDDYTFDSSNELEGTATVFASHLDKKYIIELVQPAKKGKDGIWAISKITPS